MAVSAEVLRTHLNYTFWASGELVDTARGLSQEELTRDHHTADKSVLGTLVHVFAADRIWLARIQGERLTTFTTPADYDLGVLERDWPALGQRWKQWAGELTHAGVSYVLTYSDLSGKMWSQPLWQIVMHVVNHGTHHRGQASGFLRAMGHVPPKLDLSYYYRMRTGA